MNATSAGAIGATRACPHCHEIILDSANVCPACNHRLRYGGPAGDPTPAALVPLSVEGSFRNPVDNGAWEYSVVLAVHDEHGEVISRRVMGVGAMQPGEQRGFSVSLAMTPSNRQPRPREVPDLASRGVVKNQDAQKLPAPVGKPPAP